MSVNDSFSIRFKLKNGSWKWSLNIIGLRLECDYYNACSIVNDIKYNYRCVLIYNNSRNHISELHIQDFREILHNEVKC